MKKYVSVALVLLLNLAAFSQKNSIRYDVSFPNAVHHEARVELTIPDVPSGPLKVRVSRSSPGRYATHEFGKNIYDMKAFDKAGNEIAITQLSGDVYEVPQHKGEVRITYTVFGNWVDGTYLGIDETHAHINMPAMFVWGLGMSDRPVEVAFHDLNKYGWKVATQLKPGRQPHIFTAPNFQYFMDSPVELSSNKQASWKEVNPDGLAQEIRLSVHSTDSQVVVDAYGKMVKRVVQEAKEVFGEIPRFDHGVYTFLNDVSAENAGDGMEHRNSTVIVARTPKVEGYEKRLLNTVSHEFFHAWNVERIRPRSLEPFNFEHANMSDELWFAEGFTQYYGALILKRAGLHNLDDYTKTLGGLLNYVLNSPAALNHSAIQMSRYAVFTDAGVSVDQNNYTNQFNSYYYYGAVIALALDLRLRSEFNRSLDDYMKAVWEVHGKTEKPYTIPDLQKILAGLTNISFAHGFFKDYIYGTGKNHYEKLLATAGLVLRKAAPDKASLGTLHVSSVDEGIRVEVNTVKGTAAYKASIDKGDLLQKINGEALKSQEDLNAALARFKPGEEVTLTFAHRGVEKTVKVALQQDTILEVVTAESAGKNITPDMKSFRDNWLSSKVRP